MKLISSKAMLLFITLGVITWGACKKVEDPKADPIDFDHGYCNDPRAVNYNWNFPGNPDNSLCFFPVDMFSGEWKLFDTIYNLDYLELDNRTLNINLSSTEDTLKQHMVLRNWCNGGITFTANKFGNLFSDTTYHEAWGQALCDSPSDTIDGRFFKNVYLSDTLFFELKIAGNEGAFIHKGIGIKQD